MSADEVATVSQQFRERLSAILNPAQLAAYDAYQQRLRAAATQHDLAPLEVSAAEQAALDVVAADTQAAALHKQILVLLRIDTLPQ